MDNEELSLSDKWRYLAVMMYDLYDQCDQRNPAIRELHYQAFRSALSIGANYAEAIGGRSNADKRRRLDIARCEAKELQFHSNVMLDIFGSDYLPKQTTELILDAVRILWKVSDKYADGKWRKITKSAINE